MKRVGRRFSFVNCLIYPCFISFVNVESNLRYLTSNPRFEHGGSCARIELNQRSYDTISKTPRSLATFRDSLIQSSEEI